MKEKIIHIILIVFAGFLWCSIYFIMEKVNIIECKTAKIEQQQVVIIEKLEGINHTLNMWELTE